MTYNPELPHPAVNPDLPGNLHSEDIQRSRWAIEALGPAVAGQRAHEAELRGQPLPDLLVELQAEAAFLMEQRRRALSSSSVQTTTEMFQSESTVQPDRYDEPAVYSGMSEGLLRHLLDNSNAEIARLSDQSALADSGMLEPGMSERVRRDYVRALDENRRILSELSKHTTPF